MLQKKAEKKHVCKVLVYVREWAKASSKSAFSGDTQGSYKIEIKASSQKEKKPI